MIDPNARRELTTEGKREYLRLLMTEGPDVAREYYNRQTLPGCMAFDSDEAAERYRKEHGYLSRIILIVPKGEEPPK